MDFGDAANWGFVIDRWFDLIFALSIGTALSTIAAAALYALAVRSASPGQSKADGELKRETA
ncbi:hypothetical protein GCM10011390_26900 [Aureimonas endophytica]|uniref:Uncharacterized protein n=2 Tax=Aureimonas endophytica TaxID=2027858 RepID=A0A916ZQE8_9HYPH|nr:hypothetical protein GCM10011390_26900 [Aureimonas endophytica]